MILYISLIQALVLINYFVPVYDKYPQFIEPRTVDYYDIVRTLEK